MQNVRKTKCIDTLSISLFLIRFLFIIFMFLIQTNCINSTAQPIQGLHWGRTQGRTQFSYLRQWLKSDSFNHLILEYAGTSNL